MYRKNKSAYDKFPVIEFGDSGSSVTAGWDNIIGKLVRSVPENGNIYIDCYQGVYIENILEAAESNGFKAYSTEEFLKDEVEVRRITFEYVSDDRLFGYRTRLQLSDFFKPGAEEELRRKLKGSAESVFVVGPGASFFYGKSGILAYADMPRQSILERYRNNTIHNLGITNENEDFESKYRRGWFLDWRVLDWHKKELSGDIMFFLDTTDPENPVLADGALFRLCLEKTSERPFRMEPFFDPGPWGGQWMKEVCNLDPDVENFAWCIDCVMEDQSLSFGFGKHKLKFPANNLALFCPKPLMGAPVYARFGNEFPIRFDFLDTMDGGNLSVQVHPTTEYAQKCFGVHYTQDESYYLLDAEDDACVYLGLKDGADSEQMAVDLKSAEKGGAPFDTELYVRKWPAKKHDHFLIPGGTIHCSGKNSMVLEVSSNIYMFTFKLWDWGRLGLDGRPRPINIEHGLKNIQWDRSGDWVKDNLVNRIETLSDECGITEEWTGLHEMEFIETRRIWFKDCYIYDTGGRDRGSCHVLNLVEGDIVVIDSPDGMFSPFEMHYAETTVIPAAVGKYRVSPVACGKSERNAILTAFVRTGIYSPSVERP